MWIEAEESDPAAGFIKLEEMVVIGESGAEVYTRMPIDELLVAGLIRTSADMI